MPYLYFCYPRERSHGILRAVLSVEECQRIFSTEQAVYLGTEFEALGGDKAGAENHAVLRIGASEACAAWREGFYKIAADLMKVDESVQSLAKEEKGYGPRVGMWRSWMGS